MNDEKVFKPVLGEWQLCPKCNGQGTVSKPPYLAGDIDHWVSSATSFPCDVCSGAKIIARPILSNNELTPSSSTGGINQ